MGSHFFNDDDTNDVDLEDYSMGQAVYMTGPDGHVQLRRIITRRHVPLGKLTGEDMPSK